MTYQNLTPEQIRRLRAYGAEARGSFPTADHAPPTLAPRRRPTYDAAALASITDGLAACNRELAGVKAAFERRQARATADAAARAAGRLTDAERADVLRRSHAVADAAAAPTTTSQLNTRAADFWSRTTPGGQTRAPALPPGFSPRP